MFLIFISNVILDYLSKKQSLMKKTTLSILSLLFVLISPCAGLNYNISFTGTGASTAVGDVLVQNLTRGTSVTVPAGNTLNLSDVATTIEQLSASDEIIRVYPNFDGKSTVSFFTKHAGSIQIYAFNIEGRRIAGITTNVQLGVNSFQVSLPKGYFAIQVIGNGYKYAGKVLNQTDAVTKPNITYLGNEKPASSSLQKIKSTGITTMTFITGDSLLYKGTSGIYSTIVVDPLTTADKTVNFNFVACTDADGNNYTTVTIGTKTWTVENLVTTKYQNGDAINNVTNNATWAALTTGAWCDYNNNAANGTTYGHLYNWYAVSDTRKIAPVGWHIPSDTEWGTLSTSLGGIVPTMTGASNVGGKLKGRGLSLWTTPNTGATNATGFSSLPGGRREATVSGFVGAFRLVGLGSYLATSNTFDVSTSNLYKFESGKIDMSVWHYAFATGSYVRCVKD